MAESIDIVLSAIDDTGPATQSVIRNFDALGAAAQSTNATLSVVSSGGGIFGFLTSAPVLLAGAAAAVVGFVAAVETDFMGIRDKLPTIVVDTVDLIWATIKDVGTTIWEFISTSFSAIGDFIGGTVGGIASSIGATLKSIADGTFDWAGVFKTVVESVVTAFAIVEWSFKNWDTVGELVLTGMKLRLVTLANQIHHLFTEVIPVTLIWFQDKWKDILKTIWDFTKNLFLNLHENAVRLGTAIIEAIQGNGFNFEWKGLTDGFKSSIGDLPKFAKREIGAVEKALQEEFDRLSKVVGEGMGQNIAKRLEQVPDIMAGIGRMKDLIGEMVGNGAGALGDALLGGRGGSRSIQLALPGLSNERFTTGVQAAGQERNAIMQAQLAAQGKETNNLLRTVVKTLETKLPTDVKAAARIIEAAVKDQDKGFAL